MKQYRLLIFSAVLSGIVFAAFGSKQRDEIMTLRKKSIEIEHIRHQQNKI